MKQLRVFLLCKIHKSFNIVLIIHKQEGVQCKKPKGNNVLKNR